MTETRCPTCELILYSCACKQVNQEIRAQRALNTYYSSRGWFRSSYPVTCRICHEKHDPGILIKLHPEYDGRGPKYVAECCGERIEEDE